MAAPTYLGIDVGTQGLKAALLEPGAGVVARAAVPLECATGLPPGHSEQHPDDWLAALRKAAASLRAEAPEAWQRTAGLAVSGQQHGLVALDAEDRVVRPALLWNDVRAAAECAALLDEVGGPAALFARLGLGGLPPGFTAGKVRWLRDHEPESWSRTARVLLPHDYVNLWLTGRFATEAGDASGTAWLDVRRRSYDLDFAELIAPGLADCLPELVAADAPLGALRAAAATELGLPTGLPVAPGGGDNMLTAFGAGALREGVAVVSLGTSGTVFCRADAPVCDPAGELAPFCDSAGGWLPLGCTQNATVATEAARRLGGLGLAAFERALQQTSPGADGVLCLPFHTGERSPDLPAATAAFLGLTPTNQTVENLARASAEGATYALGRLLDRLRELGPPLRELRVTGGGSHSPAWCRIVADVAGVPVSTGVDADAAALGAAVQAVWVARRAAGERDLDAAACRDELALDEQLRAIDPDPDATAVHAQRRRVWLAAAETLRPLFPALRAHVATPRTSPP
ncbi:MAG: xylulokinase [Planctomycetes bacterium]|nr:xylulokinase [Planctomycetota bacterium]